MNEKEKHEHMVLAHTLYNAERRVERAVIHKEAAYKKWAGYTKPITMRAEVSKLVRDQLYAELEKATEQLRQALDAYGEAYVAYNYNVTR